MDYSILVHYIISLGFLKYRYRGIDGLFYSTSYYIIRVSKV